MAGIIISKGSHGGTLTTKNQRQMKRNYVLQICDYTDTLSVSAKRATTNVYFESFSEAFIAFKEQVEKWNRYKSSGWWNVILVLSDRTGDVSKALYTWCRNWNSRGKVDYICHF